VSLSAQCYSLHLARIRASLLGLLGLLIAVAGIGLAPAARAADVLILGSPTTLSFNDSTQTADLTIAAATGERLTVDVTAAALVTSTFWGRGVAIELVRPDGSSFGGAGTVSQQGAFALPAFDSTGTWTLHFAPLSDTTGSFTFVATKPVDTTRAVTPGTPVTVTYPGPGVNVRLTFPATAGTRFTLSVTDSRLTYPFGSGSVGADLLLPGGTGTTIPGELKNGAFYEQDGLFSTSGTATVVLRPDGATGTQKVTIGVVSDATGTLALGRPKTLGTTVPGQNASYTFTGQAGKPLQAFVDDQRFTVGSAGGSTTDGSGVLMRVTAPDGTDLGQISGPGSASGSLGALPESGTYTLRVDPIGDTVGTARLTLRHPQVTTSALRTGTATAVRLTRGDVQRYTFSGRTGQRLGVQVTNLSLTSTRDDLAPRMLLRVVRPDGTVLYTPDDGYPFHTQGLSGPGYVESPSLDQNGTWALELEPELWVTGTARFTARVAAGLAARTVVLDRPVTATVGTPTEWARYTFTGTRGLRPTIDLADPTWRTPNRAPGGAHYVLLRPDGSTFGGFNPTQLDDGTTWGEIARPDNRFDVTGTWTLLVDPLADATGSERFTLHQVRDVTGPLVLGRATSVSITRRGTDALYRFTWDGQGALDWAMDLPGDLVLTDPDGNEVAGATVQEGSTSGRFTGNGTAGTWTLRFDPGPRLGAGRLTLSRAAP
jgi:hypothetical protein